MLLYAVVVVVGQNVNMLAVNIGIAVIGQNLNMAVINIMFAHCYGIEPYLAFVQSFDCI